MLHLYQCLTYIIFHSFMHLCIKITPRYITFSERQLQSRYQSDNRAFHLANSIFLDNETDATPYFSASRFRCDFFTVVCSSAAPKLPGSRGGTPGDTQQEWLRLHLRQAHVRSSVPNLQRAIATADLERGTPAPVVTWKSSLQPNQLSFVTLDFSLKETFCF